jgi:hypothetical protein
LRERGTAGAGGDSPTEKEAPLQAIDLYQCKYKRCLGWQESGVYALCIFNTIEPGERAHTRQKCVFCAPNNMLRAISTAKGRGAVLRLLKKFYAARVTHPAVYTTALQRLEGQASADVYEQMRKSAGTAGAEDREAWETALKKICIRACEGAHGTAASGR